MLIAKVMEALTDFFYWFLLFQVPLRRSLIVQLNMQATTKFHWKHILALNYILKKKLQINSFIENICLYGSSHKNVLPYQLQNISKKWLHLTKIIIGIIAQLTT